MTVQAAFFVLRALSSKTVYNIAKGEDLSQYLDAGLTGGQTLRQELLKYANTPLSGNDVLCS